MMDMGIDDSRLSEIFGEDGVSVKLKIMHAVDRSLDKVTVSKVCERAGVSRQVFYRNFESKYSLHWWWPMHCHRFYLAEVGRTLDWETGYRNHVWLLSLEKDFFQTATQYTLGTPCLNSIMPHVRTVTIMETLRDYRGMEIDEDLMFCINSWVKTETEVLTEWYRTGTVPEPAEAARMLVGIMPVRLREAMELVR